MMATRGVDQEVEDAFTRALELFERGGDSRQHYSVLRGLASIYLFRGQVEQVARLGQEILEIGEREADKQIEADGHLLVGAFLVTAVDPPAGLRHLDQAIALIEGLDPGGARPVRVGNDPRVACYTTSALTLQMMGLAERAVEHADAALALAARIEHPFTTAYAQFHAGLLHLFLRDAQAAHTLAVKLLETAEEHGFRIWIATGRSLRGAARVALGKSDEGLADIRSGMNLYQDLRSPPIFWPFLQYIGAGASHLAGQSAEALTYLDPAIERLGHPEPGGSMLPELQVLKGDIIAAQAAGDLSKLEQAEALYRAASARAQELTASRTQLRAAMGLVRLEMARAQPGSGLEQLAAVYAGMTEGFETVDMIEARDLMAEAGR
jgi:tetratricopeptide (TPR) repeat protein